MERTTTIQDQELHTGPWTKGTDKTTDEGTALQTQTKADEI